MSAAVLLDATPLSAAGRREKSMHAWLSAAQRQDSRLYVSTASFAESFTGAATDAGLRRLLPTMTVIEVSQGIGIRAGALRSAASSARRTARDLTVDSLVVATAEAIGGSVVILTGDPDDMMLLLRSRGTPRGDVTVEPL